jgi:tetratricopeptide (TPR) repeat protein
MSLLRIVTFLFCLVTVGVATASTGGMDYKELYKRGVEHNKKGEFDEAIKFYSEAIALKPDSEALFFVRGRAYLQKKDYGKAISDLDKAILLKPNYAEAYNTRGIANIGKDRKQPALADFTKACKMGLKDACKNLK